MAGLTSSCRLLAAPAPAPTPEQLFAAGWSACFIGAMGRVARSMKIALPGDVAVDAEVDLGTSGDQFLLRACLTSACRVWSAMSPARSLKRLIRCARIPRPHAATSTSLSI
jgi:organic hydroperoxide reductase OsmC/OhrA